MPSAIVVGAGLTGLSAALAFRKMGWQVTVLEERNDPGGVIRTIQKDGWLVESACSSLQLKSELMERIITEEAGLSSEMLEPGKEARTRYIVRNGAPVAVPFGPLSFIKTPLWTAKGKLRFFGEAFVPRSPNSHQESIAQFVTRRCGPEFYNYGINPLVSGIHAGDPERLSIRLAFPKVWELESRHGGLIKGAIAGMLKGKKKPRYRKRLISFRNGMQSLPQAMASKLGDCLRLQARILSIRQASANRWDVSFQTDTGQTTLTADCLLITVPLWCLNRLPLPAPLLSDLLPLQKVEYAPVATVALGYKREQVAHPLDGFGMLVPTAEKRRILGTLFHSTLFPNRAPDGHVLLTTFIGGMQNPQYADQHEGALADLAHAETDALLKIYGQPVFRSIRRWPKAIPQYHTDYDQYLAVLSQIERAWPGLVLAGNFRGGIAAGDCLVNGWETAERLASTI